MDLGGSPIEQALANLRIRQEWFGGFAFNISKHTIAELTVDQFKIAKLILAGRSKEEILVTSGETDRQKLDHSYEQLVALIINMEGYHDGLQ